MDENPRLYLRAASRTLCLNKHWKIEEPTHGAAHTYRKPKGKNASSNKQRNTEPKTLQQDDLHALSSQASECPVTSVQRA